MKILWLSHLIPYPPKAGVLLRAYHLIKELSKYHEVHLLAFNQSSLITPYFDSYDQGIAEAHEVMHGLCGRVRFVNCPVDKSPTAKFSCALRSLFTPQPYTVSWLKDAEYKKLVADWRHEENYDLIHCDTISLAPYIEPIDNSLLCLDHHNVESHMLFRRAKLEENPIKKFYFWQEAIKVEHYEKHFCPKFDTNITCSDLDSGRLNDIATTANFTTIPNGVDTNFFAPCDRDPELANFIFIGTLSWYPNTRAVRYMAEEIWPKLKKVMPNATINIIGTGAPADLVRFGEDNENFNILGYVDDLNPYFEAATAYLCPIDDGGGTKLKVLDALASGKAVIANPIACEGLGLTNGSNILYCSSADDYIESISQIVEHPELRQKLQRNARKHACDHFSFESIGKYLSSHFENLPMKA